MMMSRLWRFNHPESRGYQNNHPIDSQGLAALWSHQRQIRSENPNKAKAAEGRGLPAVLELSRQAVREFSTVRPRLASLSAKGELQ